MLRRPDSRRSTTQTWYFSSGMLTCGLPRLVVQVGTPTAAMLIRLLCALLWSPEILVLVDSHMCSRQVKGGVAGLYDGAEVVLGPDSGLLEPGPEQQFINQKMRPGSGVLSVQVLPDGPTRVLQVRTKPVKISDSTDAEQLFEALVNLNLDFLQLKMWRNCCSAQFSCLNE